MKRFLAVTAVFMSTCALASAQDEAREDGPYVRIGGGVSLTSDFEQNIAGAGAACLAIGCNPDRTLVDLEKGFIAGGALGFDYADGIRTELEYRYASSNIAARRFFEGDFETGLGLSGLLAPVDDKLDSHFIFSNFYFDFYNSSPITPFIGGGVGGAFIDIGLGERDAVLAYQGRAGLSVDVGGGFLADLEYVYVRTNNINYGPRVEDLPGSGEVAFTDGNYEASNVMLSLRKPF
ncbi:MAG: P44/Msp2 family outer membrane protein [Pseudomonadota bacterium]